MKKNKKKIMLLITVLILLAPLIYSYYSYSKIRVTNRYVDVFSNSLKSVINEEEEFDMTDVTDFDWDTMMVFGPYTSREEMEKKVGQEWTTYSYIGYYVTKKTILGKYPLDDDSFNKIIFIKGEKIVLDVTFNRGQVDLTEINQVINREEAQFYVQGKVLKQKIE